MISALDSELGKLALHGGKALFEEPIEFCWPPENDRYTKVISRMICESEISYYGKEGFVEELENRWSQWANTDFAVSTNSGTSALHLAYHSLEIGTGTKVAVQDLGFFATVTPLLEMGASLIFLDCEAESPVLDLEILDSIPASSIEVLVVTHLFGHLCDLDELRKIVHRKGWRLVEDCSHAHGATFRGRSVGTFGDCAAFSLGARKTVTGGCGGITQFKARSNFERAVLFGHFNKGSADRISSKNNLKYAHSGTGQNYRIHPFAAAMICIQLDDIDLHIRNRQANLRHLDSTLNEIDGVDIFPVRDGEFRGGEYAYHAVLRPSLSHLRNDIVSALTAEGCPSKVPQYAPLHQLPIFCDKNSRYIKNVDRSLEFPTPKNSVNIWSRLIPIPTFTMPSDKWKLDGYVAAIKKVLSRTKELGEAI